MGAGSSAKRVVAAVVVATAVTSAAVVPARPSAGSSAAASSGSSASSSSTASRPDVEADFVNRINTLRAQKGLRQLVVDAELTAIGRRWAAHMSRNGLRHNPNFQNEVTQDWELLGENVGTGPDVPSIMEAFIKSPSHYKNLVEPRFEEVGVGVVLAGDGTVWTAHQFMQLRPGAAAPPPTTAAPRKAPTKPAPTAPAPPPAAAPAATPAPVARVSARVVFVLEQLRALDAGHPR